MPTYPLTDRPIIIDDGSASSAAIQNTGTTGAIAFPLGRQIPAGQTVTVPLWANVRTTVQAAGGAGAISVTLSGSSPAAQPGPGAVKFEPGAAASMTVTVTGGSWYSDEALKTAVTWPQTLAATTVFYPAAPGSVTVQMVVGSATKTRGLRVVDGCAETVHWESTDAADGHLTGQVSEAQTAVSAGSATYAQMAAPPLVARQPAATAPRKVIWDTDWWTDVDDAVALRLLCHAERIGLVDLQAVVCDTRLTKGPGSLSAMLEFEGRRGVPIGVHTYVPSGTPPYQSNLFDLWPHHYGYWSSTLDSTTVYRQALAAAPNGSVDIICVGYVTALKDLLTSSADSISSLTGAQLVAAKVSKLWVMGGHWPTSGTAENNFGRDTTASAAANNVVANWPTPVTFLGFEVGVNVLSGDNLTGTASTDPLAKALSDFGAASTGRSSWDPMATWLACLGDAASAGYTTVTGTASVNASTGICSFTAGSGSHSYVVPTSQLRWFREDMNKRLLPNANPPVDWPPGVNTDTRRPGMLIRKPATPGWTQPARTTGSLATGLLMHYDAQDVAELSDTTAVSHWDDRMLNRAVRQLTSAARPTKSTVGGKACLQFASGQWLFSDTYPLPSTLTVYARVQWAVVPTGNQTVVAAYDGSGNTTVYRSFHLKAINTGIVQSAGFKDITGTTDNAGSITQSTWQTIAVRLDGASMETFLDGVSDGATARSGQNGTLPVPIILGSRYWDASSEQFVGYLREVRIYGVKHDDATVAAVVSAMNV